jgi:HlyD family secretion protein
VTAADVKQAELAVTTVHNDLRKAKTALTVLTQFKNPTDTATLESAVSQASQKLARVKRTNASMLSKSQADVDTKQLALQTKTKNLQKLQEQLEFCKIIAPSDGMAVYARDDDDFRMVEGAQVRERQRLIRLPDVSQMKAVLKINESQVPRLRVGQRALVRIVGVPDPVGATVTKISPMADGSSRWWNPELREYPVELVIDRTTPEMKPGLTLQGEIFVEQLRGVTAAPLASLYSKGRESYVFVRRGDDVEPAKVQIGGANETHAHITSGVSPGQEVLVLSAGQGRSLLERAGIETSDPFNSAAPSAPPEAPPAQAQAEARPKPGVETKHGVEKQEEKDVKKDAQAVVQPDARNAAPGGRQGGGRNRGQGERSAAPRAPAGQTSSVTPAAAPAAVVTPKPVP